MSTDDQRAALIRAHPEWAAYMGGPGQVPPEPPLAEAGSGPHDPGMEGRLGKLEAAVDGLHRAQNWTIAVMLGVGAILATFMIYALTRIDTVQDTMNASFDQLRTEMQAEARATRSELVGIANAIASSITAARDQRPVIINVPPAPPPAQPPQQ